jgi:hypothetical protein
MIESHYFCDNCSQELQVADNRVLTTNVTLFSDTADEDQWQALARVFLAPPTPTQTKLPAQVANENTTKESLICACGKAKKAGFNQCYECYIKRANKQ